jgi:hypothetical protein
MNCHPNVGPKREEFCEDMQPLEVDDGLARSRKRVNDAVEIEEQRAHTVSLVPVSRQQFTGYG